MTKVEIDLVEKVPHNDFPCSRIPMELGPGGLGLAAKLPGGDGRPRTGSHVSSIRIHVAGQLLRYRLLTPAEEVAGEKLPLIVFLHGAGERGNDNQAQLKHGVRELCSPERRRNFPCYVLAPQCPAGERWADVNWFQSEVVAPETISRSLQLTLEVVDQLLQQATVDVDRIYITGLSMGGYGTWDALLRRPNFFAAALPICGGGDPRTAGQIKHIPIACFHGANDKVVTPDKSRKMIEALRAAGGRPLYTEYPEVDHDSWTPTYASDEHWQWLFSQRRR